MSIRETIVATATQNTKDLIKWTRTSTPEKASAIILTNWLEEPVVWTAATPGPYPKRQEGLNGLFATVVMTLWLGQFDRYFWESNEIEEPILPFENSEVQHLVFPENKLKSDFKLLWELLLLGANRPIEPFPAIAVACNWLPGVLFLDKSPKQMSHTTRNFLTLTHSELEKGMHQAFRM